jgi:hypothetical protein
MNKRAGGEQQGSYGVGRYTRWVKDWMDRKAGE